MGRGAGKDQVHEPPTRLLKLEYTKTMNEEIEDFESRLMRKYPDLFLKDEDGNPKAPDCGVSCPVGWQPIVEKLCRSIDWRVKNGKVFVKRKDRFLRVKRFVYNKAIYPVIRFFSNLSDPVPEMKIRKSMPSLEYNQLRDSRPNRKKIHARIRKIESFLRPGERFDNFPIPPVTIDQVKEKFGGLRFYYSGGDDQISGMVSFAESLCDSICEETGNAGRLCVRGGWWRTLCEEKREEYGYKINKQV